LLVESSGVDNETTGETFACMLSSVFSRTGHLQHRFAAEKGTYVQGVCGMSRRVSEPKKTYLIFKNAQSKIEKQKIARKQNAKSKRRFFFRKVLDWESGSQKQGQSFQSTLSRREVPSNLLQKCRALWDPGRSPVHLLVDASSFNEEIEPLVARRTILLFLRRSGVGSISNRGRNEPASFCGKQDGSRTARWSESGVHVGAWLRLWHVYPALP
jgi:hypothetical protein